MGAGSVREYGLCSRTGNNDDIGIGQLIPCQTQEITGL